MIGAVFDQTVGYSQPPAEVEKLLNYYFDKVEIKNKVILDVGCRVGDYAKAMIGMGARKVIGIDLSKKCINTATKRYRKNQRMDFYQGDCSNLGRFKNQTFDVVFCIGTINYLEPKKVGVVLQEFNRVTGPGGVILVLFQKDKGLLIRLARAVANVLPLKQYLWLIENCVWLVKPLAEKIINRRVSLNYLKYDILLSLRGIHFGIPVKLDEKYRTPTVTCEQCSETTTASYKIMVT